MALSFLLAVGVAIGLMLAGVGAALPLLAEQRRFRRRVLDRLAGRGAVPEAVADRPVALRRAAQGTGWRRLFPEDVVGPGGRWGAVVIPAVVVGGLSGGFLAAHVTGSWIAVIVALMLPAIGTSVWSRRRVAKRGMVVDEAVPEALDMIVRALRIGYPISTAIHGASRDLEGPLADEFAIAADRISYGQSTPSALQDLAERCDNQNLRFFAAAVSIQSVAGGNLAEVLERLAVVARGRIQMRRKIVAITAEAKWSGRFLSVFPLFATGVLLSLNPGFYDSVSGEAFFVPLLAVVGVLLVVNVLFMHWLVRME